MGDISKHFNRSEFACKCGCGFDVVDVELVNTLETLRQLLGPVSINSGCRCKAHNDSVGGSPHSQHLLGKAADVVVKDMPADTAYEILDKMYPDSHGVGRYNGRTHIDVRESKARWDSR